MGLFFIATFFVVVTLAVIITASYLLDKSADLHDGGDGR